MSILGGNFYRAFDWRNDDPSFNWKEGLTFTEAGSDQNNFEIDHTARNEGDVTHTLHAIPEGLEAQRYSQQAKNKMVYEAISELTGIDPNLRTGDLIICKQNTSEEDPFLETNNNHYDNPMFRLEAQRFIASEYLELYAENTSNEVRKFLHGPIFGFMQIKNHAAQEYFAELQTLASFGNDVVKDLRKQIVEFKYAYPGLSDEVVDEIIDIHNFVVELNKREVKSIEDLKACTNDNQFIKNLFRLD